jgi:hypothetical protein
MTGGTATAAAGEVAGQAVRTQRDDLEVPQPAERARGKAAGQPDAREAELDDRGVARDAGADTFQPTRAACRRGRTAAPTARPAAASVSSRTRCFFGACGFFLSSSRGVSEYSFGCMCQCQIRGNGVTLRSNGVVTSRLLHAALVPPKRGTHALDSKSIALHWIRAVDRKQSNGSIDRME